MNLQAQYQADLDNGLIEKDKAQEVIVTQLQDLQQRLIKTYEKKQSLLGRIQSTLRTKHQPEKGLYIWGGVGIGKTYLMDLFFESLPFERKLRLHFHRFMQQVHADLKRLQGRENPLDIVARHFTLQAEVLCFDEFFVSDITDAMLLANLFQALFERGVCLVATSNLPPDDLYRNGLQRARFLPAIDLIKQHTQVLELDSDTDYRLRNLAAAGVYFTPLNADAEQQMQQYFQQLTLHAAPIKKPLMINGREIATNAYTDDVVWFDFDVICNVPRSQMDYLDIAQSFGTVLLSNIPIIEAGAHNTAKYLINFIDVMYDAQVKLIASSAASIAEIYKTGKYQFEFQRTQSRLQEMQSQEYWHKPHRP